MSFGGSGGGGGTVSGSTDVVLNSIAGNQGLVWNSSTSKWNNVAVAQGVGGGVEGLSTNSSASGAVTLDLANGNVFNVTMTGDVTGFTFNGATSGKACSFGLYLHQDSTGGRAVNWGSGSTIMWAGGTAPTITSTASATDIYVFESIDGGTTWFGSLVGADFS